MGRRRGGGRGRDSSRGLSAMSDLHSLTKGSPGPRAAPRQTQVWALVPQQSVKPHLQAGNEGLPTGTCTGPSRPPFSGSGGGWGCRSAFPQDHLPITDRGSARPELRQALPGTSSSWGCRRCHDPGGPLEPGPASGTRSLKAAWAETHTNQPPTPMTTWERSVCGLVPSRPGPVAQETNSPGQ